VQDGVKSRECDQGCENRQVFLVAQASTRNCRVVVEPEKTLGNRSTRTQCCSPPSKRATDEEEQEDERTLDVRVGRESCGSRGREGERVVVTIIRALNRGNASSGWLAGGSRFKRHLPPSTLAFHSIFGARTFSRRHRF
jgi:hypothetical protein